MHIGDIPYWNHLPEMLEIESVIANSSHVRDGSIRYWFTDYYNDKCLESEEEEEDSDFWGDWGEEEGAEKDTNVKKDCSDGNC